jgi:hypothetical protein
VNADRCAVPAVDASFLDSAAPHVLNRGGLGVESPAGRLLAGVRFGRQSARLAGYRDSVRPGGQPQNVDRRTKLQYDQPS